MHKYQRIYTISLFLLLDVCYSQLQHFLHLVRLFFESKNDILDVEGSTEELGKTVGADEKIQKMTYPRLYGTEASKEIARRLVSDAVGSLEIFSSEAEVLREIAYYLLGRKN